MANPNPSPETRFQPGQSGNPAGYSRKRRISDRLAKLIEQQGLTDTVAVTWLGAALGDEKLLKGRKPNAAFFAMLLDRLEGKVTEKVVEERRVTVVRKQRTRPGDRASASAPDAGDGEEIGEAVQCGELRETLGEDDPGPGPDV